MSPEKPTSDSVLTVSATDSENRDSQLSKRAFLYRVAVTGAATAPAGLAGCQSSGDDTGEATPTSTPTESSDNADSSAGTPEQNADPEVTVDLASTATTFQPLEGDITIGNREAVENYGVTVETPAGEELEFDENPEQVLTDSSLFTTAGEYIVTVHVETPEGKTERELTVTVDWLRPGSLETSTWDTLMAELASPAELYSQLTADGEFTEQGRQAGKLLETSSIDEETRLTMARAIIETQQDGLDQYDIGALKTIVNNPDVPTEWGAKPLLEDLPDNFLEQTEINSELTLNQVEKLVFGLTEDAELEHTEEIQELRDLFVGDGYNQKETDYLSTVAKYDSQTINAVYPRIEQAQQHGLFEQVLENEEIDEEFLHTVSDHKDNGLISARDPAPHQYSATPDPYASGFIKDTLGDQYDPEEPLAIFMYELSENANPGVVPEALEVMQNEYEQAGTENQTIQTLLIKGNKNIDSIGENDTSTIEKRLRERWAERPRTVDLEAIHYILFDEYEETDDEYTAWGKNDGGSLGHALVHTDPYELPGSEYWTKQGAVIDALMAETLDSLVYDTFAHKDYYRDYKNLSEKGKKSWASSDLRQFDPDNKKVLSGEYEDIMDDNLNYNGDEDAQRALMGEIESPIEDDIVPVDRFRIEDN